MLSSSFLHLLLLIIVANASPIIVRNLMGERYAYMIDGGRKFVDGQPILGSSKTWRGLASSIIVTTLAALLLGYEAAYGFIVGLLAMTGDLFSSFIKRRLKLPPSSMAPLLDQIPESFLPAVVMAGAFSLSSSQVSVLVIVFIVFELAISVILYRWGIRKRPY